MSISLPDFNEQKKNLFPQNTIHFNKFVTSSIKSTKYWNKSHSMVLAQSSILRDNCKFELLNGSSVEKYVYDMTCIIL